MKPTYLILLLIACIFFFSTNPSPGPVVPRQTAGLPATLAEDSTDLRVVLLVKNEGDIASSPLRMNELKVDVQVMGNIATTTLEMNFYNDLDRVLEGSLVFPLNEGQTVSRFAMDVNGKLREGVVVEKQKGQQVFETVVRRSVDPGLLEWTRGNNFRARVYPIPAKGNKRILVAYEQELRTTRSGSVYLLPLGFPDLLDKFDLKVEVFQQKVSPKLYENELADLKFNGWKENYVAEMHEQGFRADRQLGFMVPAPKDHAPVYLEKGPDGSIYYYFRYQPQVTTAPKPAPKRIALLWDASASGAKRDHAREFALLEACFARYQNVQVELVRFAINAENPLVTQVAGGKWSGLRALLENTTYDGATQLGCLDLGSYAADEYYLFSDGISNFGEAEIKLAGKPLYCISSGPNAEYAVLRDLADRTGGMFISLRENEVGDALGLLSTQPYRLIAAQSKSSGESYPRGSTVVTRDFTMAGKLDGVGAEMELHFGIGDKVMDRKKVFIDGSSAGPGSGMVQRLWAQKKLAHLERDPRRNEKEIVALGKQHGLVTRYTSLIVLETLEDYLEFDIAPPQEMLADWLAQKEQAKKELENTVKEHLGLVLELWEGRKEWWKKEVDWKALKAMINNPSTDSIRVTRNGTRAEYSNDLEESTDGSFSAVESEGDAWGDEGADDFGGDEFSSAREESVDEAKLEEKESSGKGRGKGTTSIKAWNPDEPYLKEIQAAPKSSQYAVYLEQKAEFGNAPSFYLDCTDYFLRQEQDALALRILSNIAEMQLEDYRLLRILGHRLLQFGLPGLAVPLFEQVLELRPEEPQSLRDLAHAYARAGREQEAVDAFWKIIQQPWDGRFPEIELIALEEMNAFINLAKNKVNTDALDKRLLENLDLDMRVVLNWDANNCDMDLWVIDPLGEKCYYSNRETALGGWMSRDFTGGYGPEEFLIHRAMPGEYKVMVHFYGNQQQDLAGATTIQVQLIRNFGRKDQNVQEVTRRLKGASEELEIGKLVFQ